jgi:hypothetical protein
VLILNSRCNSTFPEVFDEFSHLFICFGVKLSHWRASTMQMYRMHATLGTKYFKFVAFLRDKQNSYNLKNLLCWYCLFVCNRGEGKSSSNVSLPFAWITWPATDPSLKLWGISEKDVTMQQTLQWWEESVPLSCDRIKVCIWKFRLPLWLHPWLVLRLLCLLTNEVALKPLISITAPSSSGSNLQQCS